MVLAYWQIGRELVAHLQGGGPRADYGRQVLTTLSADLSKSFGKGYSVTNLRYFRLFYQAYADRQPKIHHEARDESNRPMAERHRRHDPSASLTHAITELARRGQVVELPADVLRSPYVLDFLDLPESHSLRENDLESAILEKLRHFLLELGKGFAFVARQKRIDMDGEHFYVDLVFYNCIRKCYLLVELKLGKLTHQDVGQMDGYVRLFDDRCTAAEDAPTIGLILCAEKNEAVARYSVLHESKQLFAARYVTYLPSVEELQREIERERRMVEAPGARRRLQSPRIRGN